jgi:hypothetical protein
VNSGSTWDLVAFLFSYVMSIGDSSIPHKAMFGCQGQVPSGELFTTGV